MKSIFLAVALLGSVAVFAQVNKDHLQYLDTEDDIMLAEVLTLVTLYFERLENSEFPYEIGIGLEDGSIHRGDTISVGLYDTDEELRYVWDEEMMNLSKDIIVMGLGEEEIKDLATHGVDYVAINSMYYEFVRNQIKASKALAIKAMSKL